MMESAALRWNQAELHDVSASYLWMMRGQLNMSKNLQESKNYGT